VETHGMNKTKISRTSVGSGFTAFQSPDAYQESPSRQYRYYF
jgi:hypothetical protein